MGGRARPFFDYATETCVTSMVLAIGAYFLESVADLCQPEICSLGSVTTAGGTVR